MSREVTTREISLKLMRYVCQNTEKLTNRKFSEIDSLVRANFPGVFISPAAMKATLKEAGVTIYEKPKKQGTSGDRVRALARIVDALVRSLDADPAKVLGEKHAQNLTKLLGGHIVDDKE